MYIEFVFTLRGFEYLNKDLNIQHLSLESLFAEKQSITNGRI